MHFRYLFLYYKGLGSLRKLTVDFPYISCIFFHLHILFLLSFSNVLIFFFFIGINVSIKTDNRVFLGIDQVRSVINFTLGLLLLVNLRESCYAQLCDIS